jgi:hypothetical protein
MSWSSLLPVLGNRKLHLPCSELKSRVCFQVPAVALDHGITVVVSPLIGGSDFSSTHSSFDEGSGASFAGKGNKCCLAM